jgi:ABC-type uncharacterized transport system substrate-binding protein
MSSRRRFLELLGGVAAWPAAAWAQSPTGLRVVGFLGPNTRSTAGTWIAAFVQRLRELGWIEGRTLTIEYRWVEGRTERFAEFAAEFAKRKVDVVVTTGTPAVMALKKATSSIPIVFATAGDPVKTGLVESLARPGGNVTGLATLGDEIAGKRLELLRAVVPNLGRLALFGNVTNPFTVLEMGDVRAAASKLGISAATFEIRKAQDIGGALAAVKGRADALYVCTDAALVHTNRVQINTWALNARVPTMQGARTYLEGGGLMSYGPNFPALFHRSADYVDKILRGANPKDVPIEQPTKFDLVLNLGTAKALRLAVPPAFLARVDEVIE